MNELRLGSLLAALLLALSASNAASAPEPELMQIRGRLRNIGTSTAPVLALEVSPEESGSNSDNQQGEDGRHFRSEADDAHRTLIYLVDPYHQMDDTVVGSMVRVTGRETQEPRWPGTDMTVTVRDIQVIDPPDLPPTKSF